MKRSELLPQPACRIAFALCAIIVLVVSLLPAPESLPLQTGWDKSDHALAFFVLGLLGLFGWPDARWQVLAGMVGYGAAIELLQGMTGYRFAEWSDLLADSIGLASAAAVFMLVQRFRARSTV
jgi:VanZ family protein